MYILSTSTDLDVSAMVSTQIKKKKKSWTKFDKKALFCYHINFRCHIGSDLINISCHSFQPLSLPSLMHFHPITSPILPSLSLTSLLSSSSI